MDGTIVDVPYDWKKIKQDLATGGKPILSFLSSLPEPEKSEKWRILEEYEEYATVRAVLKKGIKGFLRDLRKKGLLTALVTNNSRKNVSFLLTKFSLEFDLIISRESGLWKPSGAPFLYALDQMELKTGDCCVIGDSHFDWLAAEDAGIENIIILSDTPGESSGPSVKYAGSIEEVRQKIQFLLP